MVDNTQFVSESSVNPCYPHTTCFLPMQKEKARSSSHEKWGEFPLWPLNSPYPPTWPERVKEGPVRPGEWEAVALCSRLSSSLGIPHLVYGHTLNSTLSNDGAVFRARQATRGHNVVFPSVIAFLPTSLHPPGVSLAFRPLCSVSSPTSISPLQPFFLHTKYVVTA